MEQSPDAARVPVVPAGPCAGCGPAGGEVAGFSTRPDPSLVALDAVVRRRDDAGYLVRGERLLVRTPEGAEHHLNRSAGAIWLSCDGTVTVGELIQELATEHGVPVEVMDYDVRTAVLALRSAGLVAVFEAADHGAPG